MTYIDGFVAAVKTTDKETYRAHCQPMGGVFKEYGASEVVDTWGDDVPEGKLTSFPMAVKREEGETVVFGWITWPSKRRARRGLEEGDGRPAHAAGRHADAVRRQAHDLRRLRADCEKLARQVFSRRRGSASRPAGHARGCGRPAGSAGPH